MTRPLGRPKGQAKSGGKPKGYKSPSTLTKEQARDALRLIVLERMQELVDAQMSSALGIRYLVTRDKRSGKFIRVTEAMAKAKQSEDDAEEWAESVEIWEKEPSVQAFSDLMNRALDKPKEQEQDVNLHAELVIRWADE